MQSSTTASRWVAARKLQRIHCKGIILNKLLKSSKKLFAKLKCRIQGGKKILVLSDSHGGVLEYIHDHGLLLPHFINCEVVRGATAYGLNNDQSTTQSLLKFSKAIKRYPTFDVIGIMLGEVDCSVALWAVAKKAGCGGNGFDSARATRISTAHPFFAVQWQIKNYLVRQHFAHGQRCATSFST